MMGRVVVEQWRRKWVTKVRERRKPVSIPRSSPALLVRETYQLFYYITMLKLVHLDRET